MISYVYETEDSEDIGEEGWWGRSEEGGWEWAKDEAGEGMG